MTPSAQERVPLLHAKPKVIRCSSSGRPGSSKFAAQLESSRSVRKEFAVWEADHFPEECKHAAAALGAFDGQIQL